MDECVGGWRAIYVSFRKADLLLMLLYYICSIPIPLMSNQTAVLCSSYLEYGVKIADRLKDTYPELHLSICNRE